MAIIQMAQNTQRQMMGYLIITPEKKLIIVDGGKVEDAPQLVQLINQYGGKVDHWLLTHPHDDHVGAFATILLSHKEISVRTCHASFPDEQWLKKYSGQRFKDYLLVKKALQDTGIPIIKTYAGQKITLVGVTIEVLSDINPEITKNGVNNSSIVYRIHDYHKSMLFLGDLGVEGGDKLFHSSFAEKLRSDYVQMAHHGQHGVDKTFYQEVQPQGCFWPTPQWLYDNNSGKGPGSGKWDTLNVRRWMAELGVANHYVAANGLISVI